MTGEEREFLSPSRLEHHSRSRNLLFLPSLAALGILVLAFSSGKLSPGRWMGKDEQRVDSTSLERATSVESDAKPVFRLIDPHNGDNGTDPAQTTTGKSNSSSRTLVKALLIVDRSLYFC